MTWLSKLFGRKAVRPGRQSARATGAASGPSDGPNVAQQKRVEPDVEPADLDAQPISTDRMDLLWLNDEGLQMLEMAVKVKVPFVLGPEGGACAAPKNLVATESDVKWAKGVDSIAAKALAASSRRDFASAIKFYREALALAPGTDIYLMSIGCCFANLGYPEKALPYLERAYEIGPDRPRIAKNLEVTKQQVRDMGRTRVTVRHAAPKTEVARPGVADSAVAALKGESIVNVWAVVDEKVANWLGRHDQCGIRGIGVGMAKKIADDAFPAIESWMKATGFAVTILMMEPFDQEEAVELVRKADRGESRTFLVRSGHTQFGGRVAIVLGTK